MANAQLQQLTAPQVCKLFGITNTTLWNWRQGTTKMKPLPEAKATKQNGFKYALRFNQKTLLAWSERNHIELKMPVEQVLTEVKQGKPGPKSRSTPVEPRKQDKS
jgi:hypothetical protein